MTQEAKDRILEWLFSQGTSTVLLVCILSFMAYEKTTLEPLRAEKIAAETRMASQEIADRMSQTSMAIAEKHRDAIDRIIASHERERDVFLAMLQIKTSEIRSEMRSASPH